MSFSCIIVDDDLHTLEQLIEYIDISPHLILVKAFHDPILAMEYILSRDTLIDILFTDVEMPKLTGLKLAQAVQSKFRLLVLVSGHIHYAIDGYNLNAQQFLSKPFNYKKFEQVVDFIYQKIKPTEDSIMVKLSGKNQAIRIYLKDITYIESAANYLKINTLHKTHVPYGSLQSMQDSLFAYPEFLRVSRSVIINVNFISSTDRYKITLENNIVVNVGESYQKIYDKYFKEKINKAKR
jgi:DNA-binding LytR/AlgR family response regulator